MKLKLKQGFSLIELIIAMTLIGILVFASSNINFRSLTEAQKLDIKTNKFILNYEAVRNDALMGKAVPPNYEIPREWKLEFFRSGTGGMHASYSTGGLYINYDDYSVGIDTPFRVTGLSCSKLDSSGVYQVTTGNSAIIQFNSGNISLTGSSCSGSLKLLKMDISYGVHTNSIFINAVNGLITQD